MKSIVMLLLAGFVSLASAQHSPYVELKERPVKALSDEDLKSYREGAGMGLALAAELNRYPGPKHVLELDAAIALTAEQRAAVTLIFDAMHTEAVMLGEQIIAAETRLDDAFASSSIDEALLETLTSEIAVLQGRLRLVHLRAHLHTRALLNQHQRMVYEKERGYGGGHEAGHGHKH